MLHLGSLFFFFILHFPRLRCPFFISSSASLCSPSLSFFTYSTLQHFLRPGASSLATSSAHHHHHRWWSTYFIIIKASNSFLGCIQRVPSFFSLTLYGLRLIISVHILATRSSISVEGDTFRDFHNLRAGCIYCILLLCLIITRAVSLHSLRLLACHFHNTIAGLLLSPYCAAHFPTFLCLFTSTPARGTKSHQHPTRLWHFMLDFVVVFLKSG